jgi:hypothetical protein
MMIPPFLINLSGSPLFSPIKKERFCVPRARVLPPLSLGSSKKRIYSPLPKKRAQISE